MQTTGASLSPKLLRAVFFIAAGFYAVVTVVLAWAGVRVFSLEREALFTISLVFFGLAAALFFLTPVLKAVAAKKKPPVNAMMLVVGFSETIALLGLLYALLGGEMYASLGLIGLAVFSMAIYFPKS